MDKPRINCAGIDHRAGVSLVDAPRVPTSVVKGRHGEDIQLDRAKFKCDALTAKGTKCSRGGTYRCPKCGGNWCAHHALLMRNVYGPETRFCPRCPHITEHY